MKRVFSVHVGQGNAQIAERRRGQMRNENERNVGAAVPSSQTKAGKGVQGQEVRDRQKGGLNVNEAVTPTRRMMEQGGEGGRVGGGAEGPGHGACPWVTDICVHRKTLTAAQSAKNGRRGGQFKGRPPLPRTPSWTLCGGSI